MMNRTKNINKHVALSDARTNSFSNVKKAQTHKPNYIGIRVFKNYSLESLIEYINWAPFFHGWGMKGKFPEILYSQTKGKEAKRIFQEAKDLLYEIINNKLVSARGVMGIFPANTENDDIVVFKDEKREKPIMALPMLRQQKASSANNKYLSLSDFIAPKASNINDYIGAFTVSAGIDSDNFVDEFKKEGDHYNSIMFRLLCDRLTEAFVEQLHEKVRKEFWGYSKNEQLDKEDLFKEKFDGIRPAPGYPACPDHTLKGKIFDLLDVTKNTGISLTPSYAMHPASTVTGFFIANPGAKYFGVGKINKDQVIDYAKRMGWQINEAEKWLSPVLNYNTSVKV